MDINDFFHPVSLSKPPIQFIPREFSFVHNITVHTANSPISGLNEYSVAIIGVPYSSYAENKTCNAPDAIREKLYQLNRINNKIKIIDLGNLKESKTPEGTYLGLREVLLELFSKKIIVVVLGGSQDLTYGISLAHIHNSQPIHLVTVDSHIDVTLTKEPIDPRNYLNKIIIENKKKVFDYTNIGHQAYFVDEVSEGFLQSHYYNSYRAGMIRNGLQSAEPLIRDANIFSFDINAVQQSDAPGCLNASPNGFSGAEACQLSRYAGLSPTLPVFGIFEVNPERDIQSCTSYLAAQMIWYFIEGTTQRINEHPLSNEDDFTKFMVNSTALGTSLLFYKSERTERWWVNIPVIRKPDIKIIVSCSYADYQNACNDSIPDHWMKAFHKYN